MFGTSPIGRPHAEETRPGRTLRPSAAERDQLAQCGWSTEEIVAFLWLRRWYQTGGSDRVELLRHWEFLKWLLRGLLALLPATQRKAVPGVLVGRNTVSIGISKDEGAPERPIIGLLDDGGSSRFHFGMQLIDIIAIDPERHTPSRMRCFIQVHFCFAESKRDGGGVEQHRIWSAERRVFGQPQHLCVERARSGEVAHLQADKIGSEKFCHECSFLVCSINHGELHPPGCPL